MANKTLDDLASQVTATTDVMQAAIVAFNGVPALIQAAVDKALANGATAAELAPVQAEVDALKARSTELAAAIVAGTPNASPQTKRKP